MESEVSIESNEKSIVTLAELGPNCPIPVGGKVINFDFKTWRMIEEKHIGQLKSKNKTIGVFVREIFDYMLTEFDGKSWDSYQKDKRKLLLNQMPWGNMFYMYFYLRYDALGEELRMQDMKCTSCNAPISGFVADLNSLEVKIKDPQEGSEVWIDLKKPVKIKDTKITHVKLGHTPWDAMEKLKSHTRNEGSLKDSMIQASVRGFKDAEIGEVDVSSLLVLRELGKKDIERIYTKLDEHNGGPVLGIDIECKECGHTWTNALNWSYDYFFGNSSLSQS